MKKKYIFFDIDGTLTSFTKRDVISESTLETIRKLKENGHFVALATGRALFLTETISKRVGINNIVCEGGNGLVINGELISYKQINQEAARDIIRQCEDLNLAWAVSLSDDGRMYTKKKEIMKDFGIFKGLVNLVDDKNLDYTKFDSIRRILVQKTDNRFNQINGKDKIGCMIYQDNLFAFIEPDDKYIGIEKMVDSDCGNHEDIIVFGDGLNDMKMFEKAPYSVAMGNSIDELKKIANYITDDSDSDGIYNACKVLKLID